MDRRPLGEGSGLGVADSTYWRPQLSISDYITILTTYNSYGHGPFGNNDTAAFVGTRNKEFTLTGLPASAAFAVNDAGAFFNAKLADKTFTDGRRAYTGGTLKAQAGDSNP